MTSRFRSGFEGKVALGLKDLGVTFSFEPYKISFVQPAKQRSYTPDFVLPNGVIIEVKGRFETADRQKHLMIRETHGTPEEGGPDIRFLFQSPHQRISKRSKTTYAMWCDKHGFRYSNIKNLKDILDA